MEIASSSHFCQQPHPGDQRLHKQPLPTSLHSPFSPVPPRQVLFALPSQLLFLEKLMTKALQSLLFILRPGSVLLGCPGEWQAVSSYTYFPVDGDIKYLLSEIFAAAPQQLTTSPEMLKKGGGLILCLCSLSELC